LLVPKCIQKKDLNELRTATENRDNGPYASHVTCRVEDQQKAHSKPIARFFDIGIEDIVTLAVESSEELAV
jgi:hypothetical protein